MFQTNIAGAVCPSFFDSLNIEKIARNMKTCTFYFDIILLQKEGEVVNSNIANIETVIDYIENNLNNKLDLEIISEAVHYSKYHLHRLFSDTVGMTVHDYVKRRQLTEAAKILVFSDRPIIEVAFICGYESQQAFSSAFKSMYKISPAQYRENQEFYPLQLRFTLHKNIGNKEFTKEDICLAERSDIQVWMDLMRLVIDGYPVMKEEEYLNAIMKYIDEKHALVLKDGEILVAAMAFSDNPGCIEFWGVHPQYRKQDIQKLFLDVLLETYLPGKEVSMTTYREGDKADTGYRELLKNLGFAERELLIEYGYPTQRFVFSPNKKGDAI